jgi:hypothetical protein
MSQPYEDAQLNDLGFLRILRCQTLQGLVDLQDLFIFNGRSYVRFLQFHSCGYTAPALEPELSPGTVYQDTSHGF